MQIQQEEIAFLLSTHDLTQRSTAFPVYNTAVLSTHDLTQRSTIPSLISFNIRFLSTHDLTQRSTISWKIFITFSSLSTHDLTQRSTGEHLNSVERKRSFNSRPHAEVDFFPEEY